jgi:hypothetical protein
MAEVTVTLRRHDLAAEVYHLKEPQKLPLVMSPEEAKPRPHSKEPELKIIDGAADVHWRRHESSAGPFE